MSEDNENIFVITKEQAAELLSKSNFNKEYKINYVTFSSLIAGCLILVLACLVIFSVLFLLSPIFFIEYIVNKIFEKKEEIKNENNNTSN